MRPFSFVLCVSTVILCCQAMAGDEDAKKIQGTWLLTELIVAGEKVPAKDVEGMKFVFENNKFTIVPPTADTGVVDKRTFTFKLDGGKQPAQVDIVALDGEHKGVTSPGIYEIKDDTLRWCQSDDPKSTERPKDVASPAKSPLYLFTFKRSK